MDITSISTRGQVVIPQDVRDQLKIQPGDKFIVVGEDGCILLKRLEMPSFEGFDQLLKKTRAYVKEAGIKPSDVKRAIEQVRRREDRH